MSERIFIGVAWPYANGSLHLGQIAGANLPPDIFARYHRSKGNEVVMVSGSDQHGTPTTIKAEQEGKTPAEIAAYYQQEFQDCWKKLGISFDLYTTTGTPNHAEVAQDIFLTLLNKDYIYKKAVSQAYCSSCQRFLEGKCLQKTNASVPANAKSICFFKKKYPVPNFFKASAELALYTMTTPMPTRNRTGNKIVTSYPAGDCIGLFSIMPMYL